MFKYLWAGKTREWIVHFYAMFPFHSLDEIHFNEFHKSALIWSSFTFYVFNLYLTVAYLMAHEGGVVTVLVEATTNRVGKFHFLL